MLNYIEKKIYIPQTSQHLGLESVERKKKWLII